MSKWKGGNIFIYKYIFIYNNFSNNKTMTPIYAVIVTAIVMLSSFKFSEKHFTIKWKGKIRS